MLEASKYQHHTFVMSYFFIFSTNVVRRILSRSAAFATTPSARSSACFIISTSISASISLRFKPDSGISADLITSNWEVRLNLHHLLRLAPRKSHSAHLAPTILPDIQVLNPQRRYADTYAVDRLRRPIDWGV